VVTSQTDSQLLPAKNLGGASTVLTDLPVVVIGAGPVGLAAAVHLLDRGLEPLVLEAGPQVGNNIVQWRHVRLFSPWRLALDPISVRLLDQAGWTGPDLDALPTGRDLLDTYLTPMAAVRALSSRIPALGEAAAAGSFMGCPTSPAATAAGMRDVGRW
jgi:Pyridine nucleotide-disulphide oxidoreductase